jgi:hypothetical protein
MRFETVPRAEHRWYLDRIGHPFRAATTYFNVTALGPSGVGKTSLLASMYERFDDVLRGSNLQLTATNPAAKTDLNTKVKELQGLFEPHAFGNALNDGVAVNLRCGVKPTRRVHVYEFRLTRRFEQPLQFDFVDFPGRYIAPNSDKISWVIEKLRNSAVVVVPISAPALMEHGGMWNRKHNRPELVYELISRAFVDLDTPRLILLCPIFCEGYLRCKKHSSELLDRVKISYGRLLDHLAFGDLRDLVAAVVTPVQTLGEIVFAGNPDDSYTPVYRTTRPNAAYAPVDTEQPLCYLLRFVISIRTKERRARIQAFGRGFTNMEISHIACRSLVKASEHLAAECIDTTPFEVIQGKRLLDTQ